MGSNLTRTALASTALVLTLLAGCSGSDSSNSSASQSDGQANSSATSASQETSSTSALDAVLAMQRESVARMRENQAAEAAQAFDSAEAQIGTADEPGGRIITLESEGVATERFETNPNARLAFEPNDGLDFGVVYSKDKLSGTVRFINAGTEPLRIESIRTSCGCTAIDAARYRNREYLPGEGDEIEVAFTPQSDGVNQKYVTIMSNTAAGRAVRVPVSAEVIAAVRNTTQALRIEPVEYGERTETSFIVESRDPSFTIDNIRTNSSRDLFTFETESLDSVDPDYPGRMRVFVRAKQDAVVGMFNERIEYTAHAVLPDTSTPTKVDMFVNVRGTVPSLIESATRYMRVPTTKPGDSFTASVLLTHVDAESFDITSYDITASNMDEESLKLDVSDVEGGKQLTLTGTVPEDTTAARLQGELLLTFDIEDHGQMLVRFNGAVAGARPPATMPSPRPRIEAR